MSREAAGHQKGKRGRLCWGAVRMWGRGREAGRQTSPPCLSPLPTLTHNTRSEQRFTTPRPTRSKSTVKSLHISSTLSWSHQVEHQEKSPKIFITVTEIGPGVGHYVSRLTVPSGTVSRVYFHLPRSFFGPGFLLRHRSPPSSSYSQPL